MPLWTSSEIALSTQGRAADHFDVNGVAFDSREVGPGDLFIALKGETTDGHRFVEQAFSQGAAGALVSQPIAGPHILVPNTTRALDALGIASRQRMRGPVIGVPGTVGKKPSTGWRHPLAKATVPNSDIPGDYSSIDDAWLDGAAKRT